LNASKRVLIAYLLLSTSALTWGGNLTVGRFIHGEIAPGTLSLLRWSVALLILLPLTYRALHRQRALVRAHWRFIAMLGLTGVTLFHTFVYLSLSLTPTINAALLFTIAPIVIVVFSWVLFRERISRRQVAGIVASLVGALLIATRGDPRVALALEFNRGDMFMLIAIPNWALYSVLLRRRPKAIEPLVLLVTTIMMGLACQIPIALWEVIDGRVPTITVGSVLSVLYVGVFAGVVAYLCWNRGVAEIGANRAGLFLHLVPVFGAGFAVVFLDESIFAFHLNGAACIAVGIYLSTSRAPLATR